MKVRKENNKKLSPLLMILTTERFTYHVTISLCD